MRIIKKLYEPGGIKNPLIMKNVFIDDNCSIGEYTYVGQNTSITKTRIGRYCSIGSEVVIGPGEHPLDSISTSAFFFEGDIYCTLTTKDLVIGNDVWIGAKAIILRGLTIGNGAVIAAGAVVTKNVPDFAIVAGVPARIIRYRFSVADQFVINNSKWWDYDLVSGKRIHTQIKVLMNAKS